MFQTSDLYLANLNSKADCCINQGGSSSGKTYSILQVLFTLLAQDPKSKATVVGQDIPNLKAGAISDAAMIVDSSPQLQSLLAQPYNNTDKYYLLRNGSKMEFKSYDNFQDAKSGKREYLFINEANGIPMPIYDELSIRTTKREFIDYNPNVSFWVHEHLIGQPGRELLISWHIHNPFVKQKVRDKLESLKQKDTELWKVYARGLTGKIEGLVFRDWHLCNEIPEGAKLIAHGLDFGFTNDETGCLSVYKQNGELWINELIYETGLTNQDISSKFTNSYIDKNAEIIADSAEPKSIEELRRLGWNVIGAKKGADSVNNSIDILKRYKLNITRTSINLRNELGRYKWKVDKSGKALNEPVDTFNHLIDPLRYIALNKLKIDNIGPTKSKLPYIGNQTINQDYEFVL